jgi:predicted outer membrane repeat protein
MFIGTEGESENIVLIKGNVAETGGALYSNTDSPIMILGNTRFEGNDSLYGGGAIYTAGALTVRDTEFIGNTTPSSGGAIYFHYNYKKPDKAQGIKEKVRRKLEIEGCTFEGNTAKLGGAVHMGGKGTMTVTGNTTFTDNTAPQGGAVNLDKGAVFTMTGGADIKVGGTWKQGTVWRNVGGTWTRASRVWKKVSGTWKES